MLFKTFPFQRKSSHNNININQYNKTTSNVPILTLPLNPVWCGQSEETPQILISTVIFSVMSYLSKVIPLARARSSSPIVYNPIFYPTTAAGARTPPLRSVSPLAFALSGGSDRGSFGGRRGYASAFAGPRDGPWTNVDAGARGGWGTRASLTRSMSDVVLPEPPTSNHPHKPIPGVTGKLIYTET